MEQCSSQGSWIIPTDMKSWWLVYDRTMIVFVVYGDWDLIGLVFGVQRSDCNDIAFLGEVGRRLYNLIDFHISRFYPFFGLGAAGTVCNYREAICIKA